MNTFVFIVHFLNELWEPCHVIIGFFETIETFENVMALQHVLNACVIAYVKNKGGNLSTMTQALTSIVSCEKLGLAHPFVGSCWGHAMFKCCQYATNDCKVYVGLITIFIRVTSILQKIITWNKKSGKGQ